jgi:hypothetical protein
MNRVLVGCAVACISLSAVGADLSVLDTSEAQKPGGALGVDRYIVTGASSGPAMRVGGTADPAPSGFVPKTEMGRAMLAARQRILASGERLSPAKDLMEALDNSRRSD